MDVTPVYRSTELGVLPREWEVVSVQNLVDEKILDKPLDGNHGNIHPKSKDYVDSGVPFVMANDFRSGQIDLLGCKFITKERADKLQKGFSITGDVLLTHKGTVGNTAVVGDLSTEYIMLTPQVTYYRVRDRNRLSNDFLRHYFDSQPFQSLFVSLAGGGTRAYLGIVKQLALPVVKPPIEEQRAIAATLTDADALLRSMDRLIEKKRDFKKAVMQQLLSGETRLPGFDGTWKLTKIDSLCEFVDGVATAGADLGYIEIGDIDVVSKTYEVSQKEKLAVRGAVKVPMGTLLISTVRPTRGAISITREEIYVSAAFCRVRPANRLLFHIVCQDRFLSYLGENSIGGTYPTCRNEAILDYVCMIPPDPAEQSAIATVLSDMDAELTALQFRRRKLQGIKQAMAQQLLTGKTRLVPAASTDD